MYTVRKRIKDKYISDLGINPLHYDKKRGIERPFSQDDYDKYDEFDGIIIKLAGELLSVTKKKGGNLKRKDKHGKILDVFWCLYACYTEEKTSELVLKKSKDKLEPLKLDTVIRYKNDAIKAIKDYLNNNKELREEIRNAIKNEYYGCKAEETGDN